MRRGLERYAPVSGYDVGPLARQKYAQLIVQKAGIFPGDVVLDVETGSGIIGVQVSRAFTRAKVIATDADRAALERAAKNAKDEGCVDRMRFVQCSPDALPFKEERFFFATVGLGLARVEEPVDVMEEIHRVAGFSGKIYAAAVDLSKVKPKPKGWRGIVFDDGMLDAMREIGFGKVQRQRIALLPDGALLDLVMAKRFDAEEDEGDDDDE